MNLAGKKAVVKSIIRYLNQDYSVLMYLGCLSSCASTCGVKWGILGEDIILLASRALMPINSCSFFWPTCARCPCFCRYPTQHSFSLSITSSHHFDRQLCINHWYDVTSDYCWRLMLQHKLPGFVVIQNEFSMPDNTDLMAFRQSSRPRELGSIVWQKRLKRIE